MFVLPDHIPAALVQQRKQVSSPFEEQQLSVPGGAAEALDELHATVSLQMLPGLFCYVPADLQALEVVKV